MDYRKGSALRAWYTEYRDIIIPTALGLVLFAAGYVTGWAMRVCP